MIVIATTAIVIGIPAVYKSVKSIFICISDDANRAYDREIDAALSNSGLRELSSYVVETTSVQVPESQVLIPTKTPSTTPNLEEGKAIAMVAARLGDLWFERPEITVAPVIAPLVDILPSDDGNLKTDTAVLIREKTKVTNHRRIMHRKRNGFTHSIVASVKLTMGTPVRDAANEKVVRKMINDLIGAHGVNIADAAIIVPIAVELVFIANDSEIVANQVRHSKRARERNYAATRGGETVKEWMWRKVFANTALQEAISGPMYGPPSVEPDVG
jgi:hypothetical protein